MANLITRIQKCILAFEREMLKETVNEALVAGIDVEKILNDGLIAAMAEVGRRFEEGEFFVPEMLIAAKTMQEGLTLIKPRLTQKGVKPIGKVVIGTVKGDLHDIGKNLVGMMLGGSGFEVIDLGVDVPPEKFVAAAKTPGVKAIGLSALLTTTMPGMEATIDALTKVGLRERVRVMVGGAPLSDSYAREIGADGYAPDASRAVKLARSLIG